MKKKVSKKMMYNMILEEVLKLQLKDGYNVIFLSTMILRKLRHPEEDLKEISRKVMKKMPLRYGKEDLSQKNPEENLMRELSRKAIKKSEEDYGKNDIVVVSIDKCLDNLEIALSDEAKLPEELLNEPQIVGATVKMIAKKVIDRIDKIVD